MNKTESDCMSSPTLIQHITFFLLFVLTAVVARSDLYSKSDKNRDLITIIHPLQKGQRSGHNIWPFEKKKSITF